MLPTGAERRHAADDPLKRNVNVPYTTQMIKGVEYAFFDAPTGSYEADYG